MWLHVIEIPHLIILSTYIFIWLNGLFNFMLFFLGNKYIKLDDRKINILGKMTENHVIKSEMQYE